MREILFRGKRVDNSEWVMSGNIIRFNDEGNGALYYIPQLNERCICKHNEADNIEGFENAMFYKVIPETVGQYTGLEDKNGTKIFEGDIVKTKEYGRDCGNGMNCVGYDTFLVKFDYGHYWLMSSERDYYLTNTSNVEIIGNIQDNPELLDGGDNGEKV